MMSSQINSVLKQALITFACKQDMFSTNLNILTSLLDRLTAEDVNLHSQFKQDSFWNQPRKAPISCVDIYEDKNITMGIFILKPGGQIPLHNHPEMYGLIKVIMGKVKVTSYSLNTSRTLEVDRKSSKNEPLPHMTSPSTKVLTVELVGTEIIDVNSRPCILEPNHKNLHKIESLDGPAAFLDILAPPYMTMISNNGPRLCSYYTTLNQVTPDVFRLHEVGSPSWYWCDMFPYTGPDIQV